MPRVHFVKSARKDNPVAKKGESYYWWKFRFGSKQFSKTQPKPSQLTQSPFYASIYDLQERVQEFSITRCFVDKECLSEATDAARDEAENFIDEIRNEMEELKDEADEALQNIPDHLQETHMLYERVDATENAYSEAENIDVSSADEPDPDSIDNDLDEDDANSEAESLFEDYAVELESIVGELDDALSSMMDGG